MNITKSLTIHLHGSVNKHFAQHENWNQKGITFYFGRKSKWLNVFL